MGRAYLKLGPKRRSKKERHVIVETVSGLDEPVTPVFATREELIDHLVRFGESRHPFYGKSKFVPTSMPREHAEALCALGFGPSLMIQNGVALDTYASAVEIKSSSKGDS